jgi:hypothetical protein
MVMFHSYVSLPEGISRSGLVPMFHLFDPGHFPRSFHHHDLVIADLSSTLTPRKNYGRTERLGRFLRATASTLFHVPIPLPERNGINVMFDWHHFPSSHCLISHNSVNDKYRVMQVL